MFFHSRHLTNEFSVVLEITYVHTELYLQNSRNLRSAGFSLPVCGGWFLSKGFIFWIDFCMQWIFSASTRL